MAFVTLEATALTADTGPDVVALVAGSLPPSKPSFWDEIGPVEEFMERVRAVDGSGAGEPKEGEGEP